MKSLIIGAAGQDGVLLAKFLQNKGYETHAFVRETASVAGLQALAPKTVMHFGDAIDGDTLRALISAVRPSEIYNLAAKSSVAASWSHPQETIDVNVSGVLNLLEGVRSLTGPDYVPKVYQASSSEMFGRAVESPQSEFTSLRPVSPYAVSKACAHFLAQTYREAYGIFVACGILYNHESSLRPKSFVTRKITSAVAQIKAGKQDFLKLGTLDVSRDWGYAGDYVEAMWLMLQQQDPDDYIVATGKSHSLTEFVSIAFQSAGIDDWTSRIVVDPVLSRPTEVARLVGDPGKAKLKLGWVPKTSFEEMVESMVRHDLTLIMQSSDC